MRSPSNSGTTRHRKKGSVGSPSDTEGTSQSPSEQVGLPFVEPDDPHYCDLTRFPKPKPGQTWVDARIEQVAAIAARAAGVAQCHLKDDSARRRPTSRRNRSPRSEHCVDVSSIDRPRNVDRPAILAAIQRGDLSVFQGFPALIPYRPYCADDYTNGLRIKTWNQALQHCHVQFNRPHSVDWLSFDIDHDEAFRAWEDAMLPAPSVICINPENGHGHIVYLLLTPVLRFCTSKRQPLEWLAAIQRGFTRRLGADRNFQGVVLKNPLHPHWRSRWLACKPHSLEDLDCALSAEDKKPEIRPVAEFGEGRNVLIFNTVRQALYREAVRLLDQPAILHQRARELAANLNQSLERPLPPREAAAIARSITRWIGRRFSAKRFSEIQKNRARRRWSGHVSAEKTKPWQAEGISRRTYYRRKKGQGKKS